MQELSPEILCAYCGDALYVERNKKNSFAFVQCNTCNFKSKLISVRKNISYKNCPVCFSHQLGIVLDYSMIILCSNSKCPRYFININDVIYTDISKDWKIFYDNSPSFVIMNHCDLSIRIAEFYFGRNHEMNIPKKVWNLYYSILYNVGYNIISKNDKFYCEIIETKL